MDAGRSLKLVLVLRDLQVGGAERVVIRLANYAARHGVDVHLVALIGAGPLSGEIADGVRLHDLNAGRIRRAALPLYRLLVRQRPNAVMSTLPQVNALTVLVTRFLSRGPRVTVREANDPRFETPYGPSFGYVVRRILATAYKHADTVAAVSEGVRDGIIEAYGVSPGKVVAIPNASLDDAVMEKANLELADAWYSGLEKRVVCVARLSAQKDHATLLKAFKATDAGPRTGLVLIGDGPMEEDIRRQVTHLGLEDRVKLVHHESNPYRWLRTANALVLSSRWEGSPNVLVEALALGVPVVATDCPSGPREILCGGRYGELVPVGDVPAMARAIRRVLAESPVRERLVERSRDFHVERVGARWLAVLFQV